jgi:hypothetical protein
MIVVAVAGCGGDASTPEADVKAASAEFLDALIDDRSHEACALTTDPNACLRQVKLAENILSQGAYTEALGDDWRERLDAAEVTFSDDNHAEIAPISKDDPGARLVREGGTWLVIFSEGSETEQSPVSDRCEPLPIAAVEHLGAALDGKRLVDPVAVRSNDFEHVYFVAARVDGSPALWAMNQLDGYSLILSINDHAYELTQLARGEGTDAHVTESDDGASEALSCVGSAD